MKDIKEIVHGIVWFSYRRNFNNIPGSSLTSDVGWGCMLRCGQMVLAQALLACQFTKNWKLDPYDPTYVRILKMFQDKTEQLYSIHSIAQMGTSEGKAIGEWMGPNTIAHVLRKLVACDKSSELSVHVAMDSLLVVNEVISTCSDTVPPTTNGPNTVYEGHSTDRTCNGTSELSTGVPSVVNVPSSNEVDPSNFFVNSKGVQFSSSPGISSITDGLCSINRTCDNVYPDRADFGEASGKPLPDSNDESLIRENGTEAVDQGVNYSPGDDCNSSVTYRMSGLGQNRRKEESKLQKTSPVVENRSTAIWYDRIDDLYSDVAANGPKRLSIDNLTNDLDRRVDHADPRDGTFKGLTNGAGLRFDAKTQLLESTEGHNGENKSTIVQTPTAAQNLTQTVYSKMTDTLRPTNIQLSDNIKPDSEHSRDSSSSHPQSTSLPVSRKSSNEYKNNKNTEKQYPGDHESMKKVWTRHLLLIIPLRLGLSRLNATYIGALKEFFMLKQCLGIIGGRPNHALYFVGAVDQDLIYLDPHDCQPVVDLDAHFDDSTYHCPRINRMPIKSIDPSLALIFHCDTQNDFEHLCRSLDRSLFRASQPPLFEIAQSRHEQRFARADDNVLWRSTSFLDTPAPRYWHAISDPNGVYDSEGEFEIIS